MVHRVHFMAPGEYAGVSISGNKKIILSDEWIQKNLFQALVTRFSCLKLEGIVYINIMECFLDDRVGMR